MRKRLLILLLALLMAFALSSCKLIKRDMDVVNSRVVIRLGDAGYTRAQVDPMIDMELSYMEGSYANFGMTFDRTDPANVSDAQQYVLDSLSRKLVVEAKAAELGCPLSEDETAALQAEAEQTFNDNFTFFKDYIYGDSEVSDAEVCAQMAANGYPSSLEDTFDNLCYLKLEEKVKTHVTKDVTVDDAEVESYYAANLEQQTADYTAYPYLYESALSYGETVYYVPAGFRYVKHIYIPFTEEDAGKLADMQQQITEAAADENADLTSLNDQYSTLQVAAVANIQTTLDEVDGKLTAGEDFDSLIALYSKDDVALEEPVLTNGYLLYEGGASVWGATFQEVGLGLENVGDISDPVISDTGVHYILFASELPEGPVALESIRPQVEADALLEKQNNVYEAAVAQWLEEADIKIDRNALK